MRTTPCDPVTAPADDRLRRVLSKIDIRAFPQPSRVGLEFLRVSQQADCDSQKLAAILGADVAITTELLRISNSAYFGFAGRIKAVPHAITVLGLRAVRQLVLCLSVRSAFNSENLYGLDMDDYWRAGVWRAVSARELGRICGCNVEESFVNGLLQDIGLPALAWLHPERVGCWATVLNALPDERGALEREIFGLTHGELGRRVAKSWGLPERLVNVIGDHHGFSRPRQSDQAEPHSDDDYKRIAYICDWIASSMTVEHGTPVIGRTRELLADLPGMDVASVDELLQRIQRGADEIMAVFGMRSNEAEPDAESRDALLAGSAAALAEMNLDVVEANQRLHRALHERDEIARRLNEELQKAQRIQRRLMPNQSTDLPSEQPPSHVDIIHGINVPARELSGDFFDYFPTRDGRLMFNLADVSGKGVDAALMMTKASSLFRCLGKMTPRLSKLLAIVNHELLETSVDGMFVTMVAGVYDQSSSTIEIVNAGHPPPLLFQADGQIIEIPAVAPPLGVVEQAGYEVARYSLAGSSLYLFSDGLLEAPGDRHEMLGYSGVRRLIRALSSTPKVQRLARAVMSLDRQTARPTDDVTMLMVEP
jgi:serine phosphatase RsbU (regulator of sigma subunit)/HD-like signal output (HDOD) protein